MNFYPICRYFDHSSSFKIKVIAGFSPKQIEPCRPNNHQYIIMLNPPSGDQVDRWAVVQAAWILEIETESLRGGGLALRKGECMGQLFL